MGCFTCRSCLVIWSLPARPPPANSPTFRNPQGPIMSWTYLSPPVLKEASQCRLLLSRWLLQDWESGLVVHPKLASSGLHPQSRFVGALSGVILLHVHLSMFTHRMYCILYVKLPWLVLGVCPPSSVLRPGLCVIASIGNALEFSTSSTFLFPLSVCQLRIFPFPVRARPALYLPSETFPPLGITWLSHLPSQLLLISPWVYLDVSFQRLFARWSLLPIKLP